MALRTPARFTVDVDLAVAVRDDGEAEAVTMAFLGRGFSLVNAIEHETTGRLAAVRLQRGPGEEVDLMFALTGIEGSVVQDADVVEILPGRRARAAALGHLVAMKLLSVDERRPRDAQDLLALLARCDEVERRRAEVAVAAMEAAGTSRGRHLARALEEWVARARG